MRSFFNKNSINDGEKEKNLTEVFHRSRQKEKNKNRQFFVDSSETPVIIETILRP